MDCGYYKSRIDPTEKIFEDGMPDCDGMVGCCPRPDYDQVINLEVGLNLYLELKRLGLR